jgi:hypothetical protein
MISSEQDSLALESRKAKSYKILQENPGKIPVVMVKGKGSNIVLKKEL